MPIKEDDNERPVTNLDKAVPRQDNEQGGRASPQPRLPPGVWTVKVDEPPWLMDPLDEIFTFIEARMLMAIDMEAGYDNDAFMYYYNHDGAKVYIL